MTGKRKALLANLVAASALAVSCSKDSNTVAGPASGPALAANVAGTWTGSYRPESSAPCAGSSMTISLQQSGADVTGTIHSTCINGGFRGRVSGSQVTGNVDMTGCTGGAFTGNLQGSSLTVVIGDFYKPLVTEGDVVMPGGNATLSR
ncbi:MAG TPA: hypothetical protein VMN82_04245 [Thermoanaerobaculia bacterium]|nr:hypothetical protein [Thermoanaerobaculia bacterium]